MASPADVYKQVQTLTADLVGISLCNNQNYPSMESYPGGYVKISFANTDNLSVVLKNRPYAEIYHELNRDNAYNLRMVDGALIQMMYRFQDGEIVAHRLAFFPSPDLLEFQNNAEIYELDEIYADIVMKNIVAAPLRFDFDSSDDVFQEIHHPRSHLTIGQYLNCRIPVSSPITPFAFLDFILRSFYNTAHRRFCTELTAFGERFSRSITINECAILYIQSGPHADLAT